MNKLILSYILILCFTVMTLQKVFANEAPNYTKRVYLVVKGKLVYSPDEKGNTIPDFSHAGYKGGGVTIPYVPVKEIVWPVNGDSSPVIQTAIDRVSTLPLDENGFRGAVLLKHGYYDLQSPLTISSRGVVLRGEGMNETDTILIGHGEFEGGYKNRITANLIVVKGNSAWVADEKSVVDIIGDYVPVGAKTFTVQKAKGFKVGDTVLVRRHGNQDWIHEIGQDLENEQCRWKPFTIEWDRVVTAIGEKTITVDAPITCAIESRWGGGEIVKYTDSGRICQVGIENLRGVSDYDRTIRTTEHGNIDRSPYYGEEYYSDENHYWNFILIDNAKNCWVRNVSALHFGNSLVTVHRGAKWVTIEDCTSLRPVSLRAGGRRFTYQLYGQLTMVQRCTSRERRHSFVLGGHQACGNVFLDCTATIPYNASESHGGWVNGTLYDNVRAPLTARWWKEIGMGWAGVNTVFWNCEGQFLVQKPPTAQNFAFGHIGIHATVYNTRFQDLTKPNGYIESWDRHVTPRSLYLAQLCDWLGEKALKNIGY